MFSLVYSSQGSAPNSKCLCLDLPSTLCPSLLRPRPVPTMPGVQVASLGLLPNFHSGCCLLAASAALPQGPPLNPTHATPTDAHLTWCRSTCCCFCCTAASPQAVREESVRAGPSPGIPCLSPQESLRDPSTLVEDSMSLSSSFREVMMGMLHTGW